jgi:hypothetical protein
MPLNADDQAKFDQFARIVSEELKVQILAMKRRVATEAEVEVVADLVSDRIWTEFAVTPRQP